MKHYQWKLYLIDESLTEKYIANLPRDCIHSMSKLRECLCIEAEKLWNHKEDLFVWSIRADPKCLIPIYAHHKATGNCLIIK